MTKSEFLDALRRALNGALTPEQVEENYRYYSSYIDSQLASGMSEQAVMEQLGDPRLIARTIKETTDLEQPTGNEYTRDDNSRVVDEENMGGEGRRTHFSRIPGWLVMIIVILLIFFAFYILGPMISALFPILLPILLIVMIIRMFNRRQ